MGAFNAVIGEVKALGRVYRIFTGIPANFANSADPKRSIHQFNEFFNPVYLLL